MKSIEQHLSHYTRFLTLQNFAHSTLKSYVRSLGMFLQFRKDHQLLGPICQEDAIEFLHFRYDQGNCSWSLFNCHYSALRKYFKDVLDIEWSMKKLPRPRKDRVLPELISMEEVVKIIEHATIFKHQVIITLLYATGIRMSEVINLKLEHIHGDRLQIFIQKGKGHKDRYVHIPEILLLLLRDYFKRYKPKDFLFNGAYLGKPISSSAIRWAIRNAKHRAGIIKSVTTHTFRHCYATHHLEAGTNLVYLQKQMGHKRLKTTAQYIKLAHTYPQQVKHPLASLNIRFFKKNRPSLNYLETLANNTSHSIVPPSTR